MKKPRKPSYELVGAVFERADGTRFVIERQDSKYVYYWLAAGSRPQFRPVAIERLTGRGYKRVPGANRKAVS